MDRQGKEAGEETSQGELKKKTAHIAFFLPMPLPSHAVLVAGGGGGCYQR